MRHRHFEQRRPLCHSEDRHPRRHSEERSDEESGSLMQQGHRSLASLGMTALCEVLRMTAKSVGLGTTGVFLALLAATPLLAQEEPQYFEEPPPRPRFKLQWEALFRYDLTYQLRARPDIERGRFEVRPELAFLPSDRFKVAVRAVGNLGTDDNDQNARNFDNYRYDGVTLDRWYVEARPGAWTILAGSFGIPLVSSEMLWDRDVPTPGAAVSHQIATGASTLTLT